MFELPRKNVASLQDNPRKLKKPIPLSDVIFALDTLGTLKGKLGNLIAPKLLQYILLLW